MLPPRTIEHTAFNVTFTLKPLRRESALLTWSREEYHAWDMNLGLGSRKRVVLPSCARWSSGQGGWSWCNGAHSVHQQCSGVLVAQVRAQGHLLDDWSGLVPWLVRRGERERCILHSDLQSLMRCGLVRLRNCSLLGGCGRGKEGCRGQGEAG